MAIRRGKRYQSAVKLLAREAEYSPAEALALVKQTAMAKFDETVEVAIRLGVDARKGDQMVRGMALLPHGTGKSLRVVVFAKGEAAAQAEEAGAAEVGAEELVKKIEEGWKDFDLLVATRDMMRLVGRLGKKLGPRMPNPKAGTVSDDVAKTVRELKSGRVEFRMDKAGIVHQAIGKVSFSTEQLQENFAAFMAALLRARPAGAKGQFIRKVVFSSTMGLGIQAEPTAAVEAAER